MIVSFMNPGLFDIYGNFLPCCLLPYFFLLSQTSLFSFVFAFVIMGKGLGFSTFCLFKPCKVTAAHTMSCAKASKG